MAIAQAVFAATGQIIDLEVSFVADQGVM